MNKFKGFKLGKGKADIRKIGAAVVATMLVVAMVIGLVPNDVAEVLAADKTTNIEGFSATMIADPDTSEDDHIFNGTPAEDGKIWTDKSVTTGAIYGVTSKENNFYVALSAMAQTYNTVETGMSAEEINIAYDVVFVLDFSGSMNERTTSDNSSPRKAQAMVNALNPAIVTLMENKQSRIAVVGYAGSNVSTFSATTLLSLDHYNTTSTNDNDEKIYFQYSNNTISTASGVTNSNNQTQTVSKQVNGGTPTQRGIYRGMDILQQAASNATGAGEVTRVPIIVLLTDGAAGSARSNYTTLSGGTFYEGDANNGDDDAEVGAYTVLTANYAKDTVAAAYKAVYDYSGISGDSIAKFYTIGLGITNNSWTHFMLNPKSEVANDATGNNATIIDNMQTILTNDATYGSDYAYADNYYGGSMTEAQLKEAFEDIVKSLQVTPQVTSTVNDPVATELSGSATGTVKFTDYLGYKMELKGDHQYLRYGGVNYRFDKQSDDSYKFSGYDQAGNAVTGPVITKNDTTYTLANVTFKAEWKKEIYNDQTGYWVITWEFPSALLPTYSRLNDYDNTDLDPIRMLYEVGLTEDVDLQKDSLKITGVGELASDSDVVAQYVFHTNLYDYANSKAMTWSEYKPAADNPFYYETGYTTDSSIDETETPYIRLDMTIGSTNQKTKQATADVQLNNISLKLSDAKATFYYDGVQYTVDLSGDEQNGATWSGEVSIPVIGHTATGPEVSVNVAARIEATYVNGRRNDDYLNLSKVTIKGTAATTSGDRNNGWSATIEGFVVGTVDEDTADTQEEIVSVYMELKGNETDGYYVEDANGNKITVAKDGDNYVVKLGDKTYYSRIFYKYADGKVSYVEKNLAKGTIAKSLEGYLEIDQPDSKEFVLTEDAMKTTFVYHAADGKTYSATGITFSDGNEIGTVGDPNASTPPAGTFKVCIDGIKNGEKDVNGNDMVVHFDFIIEPQTLEDGTVRYVVLDCSYWESEENGKYAVDIIVSDTPEVDATTGNYKYAVSYTIESIHSSGQENVTQTAEYFFNSDFEKGNIQVLLGNNGRVAVDISTAYDKSVTVEKEWYNRLGNKLDATSEALKDVSVIVGLYQQYEYTNADEETIIQKDTNGVPFTTVVLNQANNFTYTWETPTLPKYLVDDNGDYRLDKDEKKVEVTYAVDEVEGATGWTLSKIEDNSTDDKDVFTLHNVPLAEFSPSVQKVWTDGAPDGYKVKMELLANGEQVTEEKKLDAGHIIVAALKQADADADATLTVTFGGVEGSSQTVPVIDFAGTQSVSREYTFTYKGEDGNGFGGEAGSGTHAEYATVTITISNTGGTKLSIANATVSYHYTDLVTNEPAKATLETYRTKSEETDTTKTSTFLMYFTTQEKAEVILDGVVDTEETKAWYNELDKWNLPMLDENKKVITYSVRETLLVPYETDMNIGGRTIETIDGVEYVLCSVENGLIIVPQVDGSEKVFKSTITNTEDYQFTVTNDEAVTSITAEKVWVDNDNAYGTRPDKITFKLKADGDVVSGKDIVVEPDTGIWNGTAKAKWTDLPIYDTETGEEITYTVEEVMGTLPTSDEYEVKVEADPDNAKNFIVTNSLDASTSMEVEKVWIDNENAYGTRPDNLYMVLYRTVGGTDTEELVPGATVVTLNEANGWKDTTTWTQLAKYNEEGKEYIYSAKEFTSLTQRTTAGVSGYKIVSSVLDGTTYKITNKLEDGAISKTVTKEWKDKALESTRPTNVTVVLSGTTSEGEVDLDPASDANTLTMVLTTPWSHTWNNLPEYSNGYKIDYTITETKVGNVDVMNNKAGNYVVSVQDDGVGNDFVVTNTLTGETTVTVKKVWENTPEGFEIPTVKFDIYNRYGGKQDVELQVTKDDLEDSETLPKYNADGDTIYYTVVEQPISLPNGADYKIDSVIGSNESTDGNFYYTAVNTYVQLLQDISGTKTWVGVTGENIPDVITIKLYRQVGDGEKEEVTDVTPTWTNTDGTIWTYTYTDLPIYENDDTTKPYTYSVEETEIDGTAVADTDYTATKDGDLNIINTLGGTVDGADLKGKKTWYGVTTGNVPDSIQVQLMRSVSGGALEAAVDTNGKNVGITVLKSGQSTEMSWSYDFNGVTLPKYDADGNKYIYSVKEISVTAGNTTRPVVYPVVSLISGTVGDYIVALDGMNITNTLKGGTDKDLTVTFPMIKEWIATEGYSIPNSITVKLTGSGVAQITETKQLTSTTEGVTIEGNIWKYIFKNLRKYTDNGITEYVYSIEETHVGDTAVENGVAGEWHVSMPDEDLIINSHNVDLVDITVNKKWDGVTGNNVPDSIQIQLYQNGKAFGVPTTLTKVADATKEDKTEWRHTFTGLPKSSDGTNENQYVYTVKELSVTAGADTEIVDEQNNTVGDYTVSYSADSLTITNTLNAGDNKVKTTYPVTKNWINADGQIPDGITIQLMQSGVDAESEVLTKVNAVLGNDAQWSYTFENLRKYTDNGITKYVYTAKETQIENTNVETKDGQLKAGDFFVTYTQQNKDATIINNRLATVNVDKELIDYPVEKVWLDKDGNPLTENLPETITVQLYQDNAAYGEPYTFTTEDISNNWKHVFKDLRKYQDDGLTPYSYSVKEIKVGNAEVTGDKAGAYDVNIENGKITNKLADATTDVTVTKTWADVEDNNIPDEIVVELHGGASIQYATLKKTDHATTDKKVWKYTFENLPIYKADGITKIDYTIREVSVTADGTTANVVYKDSTSGTVGDYTVALDGLNITNTLKQGGNKDLTVEYPVIKNWDVPTGATLPSSITVQLYRDNAAYEAPYTFTAEDIANNWKHVFTNLRKYTDNGISEYQYSVKETKVDGYEVNDGKVGAYTVTVDGNVITNKLSDDSTDLLTEITVTKKWKNVNTNNMPSAIKVHLYRDGEPYGIVTQISGTGDTWTHIFRNLPKYSDGVTPSVYTVKELSIFAGEDSETVVYETETEGTAGDYKVTLNQETLTITNTLKDEGQKDKTVDIPFTKLWRKADGTAMTENLPTEITVQLLRDGTAMDDKVQTLKADQADASDASKWTGKFTGLRKYSDNGITKYKYTVTETSIKMVVDGKTETVSVSDNKAGSYEVSINDAGDVITNQLSQDPNVTKTSATITKTWVGVTGSNIPSIKVQLLQDGKAYGSPVVLKADTEGLTVVNGVWNYTFNDLPVYQSNGIIRHVYTVAEVEIDGVKVENGKAGDYESNVNGLAITNKLTGTVDEIEGKKIWKDAAKVSERPEKITVALLRKIQGGTPTEIATQEVSGTEWGFVFTKDNQGNALNKYDPDGNEYIYSVAEKDSQGNLVEEGKLVTYNNNQYRVSYGESVYTITNTLYGEYDPKYNPIKVTKVWLDDDNSQKKRPDSISMTLVQNGDLETIELTAQNQVSQEKKNEWSDAFTRTYPMYDAEGALISYSVKENSLTDYTLKETKGTAAEGFTLTNVYAPGETTITVNKVWVDNSNALKTRPETLTLNLLQNGEAFGTIELKKSSQGNTWTATKNVPSTDENGKLYTYTVKEPEDALKGTDYVKTAEEGLTVTNTLQGEVHVQGTKTWKNIDKEYRPESITVELWRTTTEGTEVQMTDVDGKVISITTNAEKEWKYDFGNFAKYDENGALYTYIVKETKIGNTPIEQSDYTVSNGEGYDLTNKLKDIKITISGKKTWVDNNDQYKMRPESITVNLLRDGAKVASVQVKAASDGTWTYEFKDLPKYNMDNGKLYTYSVEEAAVENYKSSVNGYDITNTLDETKIPTPSAPKTSDSRTAAGYALTTLIALAAVATAFFRRKRIVK